MAMKVAFLPTALAAPLASAAARGTSLPRAPWCVARMTVTTPEGSDKASCSQAQVPSPAATGEGAVEQAEPAPAPMHFRLPVVGLLLDQLRPETRGLGLARRYGGAYRTRFPTEMATVVTDLAAAHACLADWDTFRSQDSQSVNFRRLFSDRNINTMDGPVHTLDRKAMSAVFSPRLYDRYFRYTMASADVMLRETQGASEQRPVDMNLAFRGLFLRTVVAIVTSLPVDPAPPAGAGEGVVGKQGRRRDRDERLIGELIHNFENLMQGLFVPRFGPVWWRAMDALDAVGKILKPLVLERMQRDAEVVRILRGGDVAVSRKSLLDGQGDMLSVLLAMSGLPVGDEMTASWQDDLANDDEFKALVQNVLGFWLAGHVTTAPAVLNCIKELYAAPPLLATLKREQAQIEELSYASVMERMPLLDSYIHEVLRLYPSATYLMRRASRATTVCGYRVRKGELVVFDVQAAQRDKAFFARPDDLQLDRFVDRTTSTKSLIVFSSMRSPHYCLGAALSKMQMKATLALLIRQVDLRLVPRSTTDYTSIPHIVPKDGVFAIRCKHTSHNHH